MDKIAYLFERLYGSTVLCTPEHTVYPRGVGDMPLFAHCTCGWESIQVEYDFEGYGMFVPEFVPFLEKYGKDTILLGKAIFGTQASIVKLCLDHLDLPLSDMLAAEFPKLDSLREKLAHQDITYEEVNELKEIGERMFLLTTALRMEDIGPIPEPKPVPAEVVAEYEEIMRQVRARLTAN